MVSLTILLAVIVAGMNIINYNTVINEADNTLEFLSHNSRRLQSYFDDDLDELFDDAFEDMFGARGPRGRGGMTRDEAEENRFFSVLVDSSGNTVRAYVERISAVDAEQAAEYAANAISTGRERGFNDDYRYLVSDETLYGTSYTRVTFLDCGRMLDSFRRFLYASLAMSVAGLIAVFGVICYFAGRIVRPVAESYEKQKRFITDAGHEIKTPLAIIKANIDVMRMDIDDIEEAAGIQTMYPNVNTDDPEGPAGLDRADGGAAFAELQAAENIESAAASLGEELTEIDNQVDRLTNLTNDLVYLSRMEEAEGTVTMSEVPVSDIVSDTAGSFRALADERGREISLEIEPMLSMTGSTGELEKLTSILVENALKYSPKGDCISVSLRREGKNIVLEVSNRSETPLSDEDLAHVFDRFYRADKSRNSAAGGHGIGLSMAGAIVAAHGGKITAGNGDGTQFIVTATMPA